jgi:hypothetical protein
MRLRSSVGSRSNGKCVAGRATQALRPTCCPVVIVNWFSSALIEPKYINLIYLL